MITTDDLLKILDAAKGRCSDAELSRRAELPIKAVAGLREGKKPSLERAAALADAVGLELVVRRKGEDIDPLVLRVALAKTLALTEEGVEEALLETFARMLEDGYREWLPVFDKLATEHREGAYAYVLQELHKLLPENPAAQAARRASGRWFVSVMRAAEEATKTQEDNDE